MEHLETVAHRQSRRHFLQGMAGLGVSAGGLALLAGCGSLGAPRGLLGGEQLETTTLRIGYSPAICFAAMYVAEDLFRSEGWLLKKSLANLERVSDRRLERPKRPKSGPPGPPSL